MYGIILCLVFDTVTIQGLELFYGSQSMFLVLGSTKDRNSLSDAILSIQPKAGLQAGHLMELTYQWQIGALSNYDYLMTLNLYVSSVCGGCPTNRFLVLIQPGRSQFQ